MKEAPKSTMQNLQTTKSLNPKTRESTAQNLTTAETKEQNQVTKAGFVALIGRPNAGKSSLLNALSGEKLALVSHKANATRSTMHFIIPHTTKRGQNCQIVFIDTPGIHKREKLLNQFMLKSALKAMEECDICAFMCAFGDDLKHYEEFLEIYPQKHIIIISKIDYASNEKLAKYLARFSPFSDRFYALVPISVKKNINLENLLESICAHLPHSPALYDEDMLTTHTSRQIAKEAIREAIFSLCSDEIPYESEVEILSFVESPTNTQNNAKNAHKKAITHINARILVSKQSQKLIVVGKNGNSIKRISTYARHKIEEILAQKIFLHLSVIVRKEWAKSKKDLQRLGYNFDL